MVNWFGPNSRDLLIHGCADKHCQYGLRRTALYRNVASHPGEIKYQYVGNLTYRGDPAMVPQQFPYEDQPYDVYGDMIGMMPVDGSGKKRLVMSVAGRLYLFADLAKDGLTFRECTPLNIPNPKRNRMTGWQEIPVNVPDKVQYIRINNERNGMGADRSSYLYIVSFEAFGGGKNWATVDEGAQVAPARDGQKMLTPGNKPGETQSNAAMLGYASGAAIITLKEPVALDKIRFLLDDREPEWYGHYWPFTWQGKAVCYHLNQGEAWYNYKVEVSADGKTWTTVADRLINEMVRSCPVLLDWNQDGKYDLLLGVLNDGGTWPHDKEYRLYLNQGTNDAPVYRDFLPLCDENGKPLNVGAYWLYRYSPQCGISPVDMNGDGKLDLIVEDEQHFRGLRYYRNVSADPKTELKFKYVKKIGDDTTIEYPYDYRFFSVVDVDGDGVPDLLNNQMFFKGIPANAPQAVTDLAVTGIDQDGVTVRWTNPRGAVKYDLRVSEQRRISELDWFALPSQQGDCVANNPVQTVHLSVPVGKQVTMALRLTNANGETSPLSNALVAAALPLRRIVLRNGPEVLPGMLAYNGMQACTLDAGSAPQSGTPGLPKLEVRAMVPKSANKQKLILLRFTDLPRLANLEQATLEMTTDPKLERFPLLAEGVVDISCSAIRDDWDAATVTYAQAALGKPWAPNELDAGGEFLSKAPPINQVLPRLTLTWDVTRAVREALQAGRTSVSLLIRAENTGKYVAGDGYNFCGPTWAQVESRPRLCLVSKD